LTFVLPNVSPNLLAFWIQRPMELRIDVDAASTSPSGALAPIYERLNTPGGTLHGIPSISLEDSDLRIRFRGSTRVRGTTLLASADLQVADSETSLVSKELH
jgi:hypothetical protein